ncbi:Gfo/Idh/MocA family oxidoreductase [Micrococcales bacterium 31B]|nr:Gfo/Idh/MocA family oxidoreductase [Micrococcales bacterium 31B]
MTQASRPTLKIAVIGAGFAGQAHAFGYRNAMMAADAPYRVELAYIVDPNRALAERVAERYGFDGVLTDIDEALASDVDAVSVALPNFLHADVLARVLASGKHVFAEKPIGRTVEEAEALEAFAERSAAVTGVGFSFRRLPALAAVAQLVREGRIGTPHTARVWYHADYAADPRGALSWRYSQEQSGGGALLDIGAHALDALHFVVGPVREVGAANLSTIITERPRPVAGAIGHGASESTETGPVTNDDVALLAVTTETGVNAQVALSRISTGVPNSLGIEVFGSEGFVSFDSLRAGEFVIHTQAAADAYSNGPRTVTTGPEHPYFSDVAAMPGAGVGTGYAEAFVAEIQEFLRCIVTGTPIDTDFATATTMMRVVGAAFEAAATRRPVAVEAAKAALSV